MREKGKGRRLCTNTHRTDLRACFGRPSLRDNAMLCDVCSGRAEVETGTGRRKEKGGGEAEEW